MSWLKPRSIRGQLISGLILFEGLLVVVFSILLVREQASEIHERARVRLESEVNLLALQSQDSLAQGEAEYLVPILRAMSNSPSIRAAVVTDSNGRVIASSDPGNERQGSADASGKKAPGGHPRGGHFSRPRRCSGSRPGHPRRWSTERIRLGL